MDNLEKKWMQKLELTWVGKDEPIAVEPRILVEDAAKSNRAQDPDTQNLLIHGDNLLILAKALNPSAAPTERTRIPNTCFVLNAEPHRNVARAVV